MKKAVIFVGSHYAGKSKTINKYLKHLLKLNEKERKFTLNSLSGIIYSQSLEEKGIENIEEFIEKIQDFQLLVLASRPEEERFSFFNILQSQLKEKGFKVLRIDIKPNLSDDTYYSSKADDAFNFLNR